MNESLTKTSLRAIVDEMIMQVDDLLLMTEDEDVSLYGKIYEELCNYLADANK